MAQMDDYIFFTLAKYFVGSPAQYRANKKIV